jgi:hypothetical protein
MIKAILFIQLSAIGLATLVIIAFLTDFCVIDMSDALNEPFLFQWAPLISVIYIIAVLLLLAYNN